MTPAYILVLLLQSGIGTAAGFDDLQSCYLVRDTMVLKHKANYSYAECLPTPDGRWFPLSSDPPYDGWPYDGYTCPPAKKLPKGLTCIPGDRK